MMAKEYFQRTRYLAEDIQKIEEYIERMESMAKSCTSVLTDMPKGTNIDSKLELSTIRIIEAKVELEDKKKELRRVERELKKVLKGYHNYELRHVLELRYLMQYSWEDIAEEFHWTRRWTLSRHKSALEDVEKIFFKVGG